MREIIDAAALEQEALEQEALAEELEQETVDLRGEIDDLESKANYWEGKAAEYHKELTEVRRRLDDWDDEIEIEKREILGGLRMAEIMMETIQAGYKESNPAIYGQLEYIIKQITSLQYDVSALGGE